MQLGNFRQSWPAWGGGSEAAADHGGEPLSAAQVKNNYAVIGPLIPDKLLESVVFLTARSA